MVREKLIIRKKVIEFRTKAGLTVSEPVNLRSLLFRLNIQTLFRPLSNDFSGMCIKSDNHKFILINSNNPIGRQNFTIGHELYHLFIQENFKPHFCVVGQFNKSFEQEYLADLFATNLLMPYDKLIELIPDNELIPRDRIKLFTLLSLENYFGVSHLALLYRLLNLDLITSNFLEESKSGIISIAERHGFDNSLYKPGNHGLMLTDYGMLADNLFKDGLISEAHYYELISEIENGAKD